MKYATNERTGHCYYYTLKYFKIGVLPTMYGGRIDLKRDVISARICYGLVNVDRPMRCRSGHCWVEYVDKDTLKMCVWNAEFFDIMDLQSFYRKAKVSDVQSFAMEQAEKFDSRFVPKELIDNAKQNVFRFRGWKKLEPWLL